MAETNTKHLVVGFTGTRNGMTDAQRDRVYRELKQNMTGALGVPLLGLHGDCVGADADFDRICILLGIGRMCRPCVFESMRAHTGAVEIAPPVRPMERNRAIVADADWVIACPPNFDEIKSGSGTWATIKFARRAHRMLTIVFPDGTLRTESPEAIVLRDDRVAKPEGADRG